MMEETASTATDAIWEGDRLERQKEAKLLERFLISETDALAAQSRDQAVVLALDSQYGEGKTWFLKRFREQLEINHPVAFVDAWVDDSNNEPLVSIMAALDDSLKPLLKKKEMKAKLVGLTKSALPIIGKAAVGAGGKLLSRYIGESFADDAKAVLSEAGKPKEEDGPADVAIDKLSEGVTEVVDNLGKAMLDQFRARQRSREVFKDNLRQLAAGLASDSGSDRYPPIFVVIDELDRCRPNYAIALLEEIKHLFDVRGVVFVIALHGPQLTESIKSVYGADFDAKSYLRRFFTRHYSLRKLSICELVVEQFGWVKLDQVQFSCPLVWKGSEPVKANPIETAGDLLSEWSATPREAMAVMDGLRLFVSEWPHKSPIEVPLLIALLLHLVRGDDVTIAPPSATREYLKFACPVDEYGHRPFSKVRANEFFQAYAIGAASSLSQMAKNHDEIGPLGYVSSLMSQELSQRFSGVSRTGHGEPVSTWSEYRGRVLGVGRFIEEFE